MSLRKNKKKLLIAAKRMRLQKRVGQVDNDSVQSRMEKVRQTCFDKSVMEYDGYFKFVDKEFFGKMLEEISPGFNVKGEPVSKKLLEFCRGPLRMRLTGKNVLRW